MAAAFRLNIVCEEDKDISFDVDGSWSIDDVKAKIQDMEGTHPDQQQLCYEKKVLRNSDCLFDLKHHWDESEDVVVLELVVLWRLPSTTKERDLARSRSPPRSPIQFSSSSVQLSSSPVPSFVEKK